MFPDTISDELINKLKTCKRVYFHSNCPDGIISRNFLQYLRSRGMNDFTGVEYHAHNPGKSAEVVEGAVFVDLSPIPEQYEEFLEAGAVILDHHNTVLPLFEKFKDKYPDQLVFMADWSSVSPKNSLRLIIGWILIITGTKPGASCSCFSMAGSR